MSKESQDSTEWWWTCTSNNDITEPEPPTGIIISQIIP
jgi:hypothetical protein